MCIEYNCAANIKSCTKPHTRRRAWLEGQHIVTRVGGVDVTVGEILSVPELEEQFTLGFTVVGGGVGTHNNCCNGSL